MTSVERGGEAYQVGLLNCIEVILCEVVLLLVGPQLVQEKNELIPPETGVTTLRTPELCVKVTRFMIGQKGVGHDA